MLSQIDFCSGNICAPEKSTNFRDFAVVFSSKMLKSFNKLFFDNFKLPYDFPK